MKGFTPRFAAPFVEESKFETNVTVKVELGLCRTGVIGRHAASSNGFGSMQSKSGTGRWLQSKSETAGGQLSAPQLRTARVTATRSLRARAGGFVDGAMPLAA